MVDPVIPALGKESFSCPHCGALSHQTWYRLFIETFPRNERPDIRLRADVLSLDASKLDDAPRKLMEGFQERIEKNEITYYVHTHGISADLELFNTWASQCFSCKAFSFWIKDKIYFPVTKSEIKPPEDLPATLRDDFEEAAAVLELSPRSSAALLRLCIQKLMPELNQKGKDLNENIGALVAKGLDPGVQKALDVVRVIGNNAVHPGKLDLKDDKSTAMSLFQLLGVIIERCITVPRKIDEMYAGLPPGPLDAIKKRDRQDG